MLRISLFFHTYTIAFPVPRYTDVLCELNAVVKKQQNVNAAITLSVNAKIVFNLDRNVFILDRGETGSARQQNSILKVRSTQGIMLRKNKIFVTWYNNGGEHKMLRCVYAPFAFSYCQLYTPEEQAHSHKQRGYNVLYIKL